jgi:hypothetical protein
MTDDADVKPQREFTPEELAYLREHRQDLAGWIAEGRFERWILPLALALGLLAYTAGYVLRASATGEPVTFLADLVYGLGFALWTGVVVAFFVQVFPQAKRRQLQRYLDAYDARTKTKPPRVRRPRRSPS